jgi:hypothetical protein
VFKNRIWRNNVKVRTTIDNVAIEEWQGDVGLLVALWDKDDLE